MIAAGARGGGGGGFLISLLAKPWIDPLCLWGMGKLLPASRLWAAAAKARGDASTFKTLVGIDRLSSAMERRLARTERLRQAHASAHASWESASFGGARGDDLAALERGRREAAQAFLGDRFRYLMLAAGRRIAAADFDIPSPDEAQRELAEAFADPDRFFMPSDRAAGVERSRDVDHGAIVEYWLRFPGRTDASDDQVYAHVYEPKGAAGRNAPSVIFCHGLAMEMEMFVGGPPEVAAIVAAGFRIVLPDAPGHNRRCQDGRYGGESFIRRAPVSAVRHFRDAALECGRLVAWCRDQGSRRVALGGISMGALSSQVGATHWAHWPAAWRADHLLLVTTTDQVSALMLNSSLAKACRLDSAIREAGWGEGAIEDLSPVVDAQEPAPLDPSGIVMVLGKRDDLTPIAGGRRLAEIWRIPESNVFLRDQGHFSAAFGLRADPAPFRLLAGMLKS